MLLEKAAEVECVFIPDHGGYIGNIVISSFQKYLCIADPGYARTQLVMKNACRDAGYPLSYREKDTLMIISGKGFSYSFDKRTGMPVSMNFEGEDLLDKPVEFNFWRAPVDNDMFVVDRWKKLLKT